MLALNKSNTDLVVNKALPEALDYLFDLENKDPKTCTFHIKASNGKYCDLSRCDQGSPVPEYRLDGAGQLMSGDNYIVVSDDRTSISFQPNPSPGKPITVFKSTVGKRPSTMGTNWPRLQNSLVFPVQIWQEASNSGLGVSMLTLAILKLAPSLETGLH